MEVVTLENAEAVAAKGRELVSELLRVQPDAVLGFATGRTPIALYEQLVLAYQSGELSFARTSSFNLDEYLGITADNPQSYRAFMDRVLFDHIDVDKHRTHLPSCRPGENPRLVGPGYEQRICDLGGVDLQILGIGGNGHIGFNEPGSSLRSRTRVKTLARRTLEDNSRLFSEQEYRPRLAITMGIATILDARRILLLATGEGKADAVRDMVEGPLSAMCPASALQWHERVTVLLDEEAAALLQHKDYYDWAYQQNQSLTERFGADYD